jgi:N-acyl-D-amino-acid deacylase
MPNYDLILTGGRVIDGTDALPRMADVALKGDRIAAIGDLAAATATKRIDARGRTVAPGFIDVHTHDDNALLRMPDMTMKVSQGVTTVVVGNCGVSLAPLSLQGPPPPPLDLLGDQGEYRFATFKDYMRALDASPAATNAACLVGHTSLRVGAMDRLDRAATKDEIKAMKGRLDEALGAGAVGMSTGLYYPPAQAAPTEEVIAIAEIVHAHKAVHTTHMRDESDRVMDSLNETFRIGREADVPVVISHHKVTGKHNFGRTRETLAAIDAARRTQPIAIDVARRVLVTWSKTMPEAGGRDLADIAREMGVDAKEAAQRLLPAGAIYFTMDEEDVQRVLSWPEAMIGSDGLPHDVHPHPRLWGTFPRVLGHYSRDLKLFPLEEAVRRMTSLTAQRFGLADRGVLREEQPKLPAAGIDLVLVNGAPVWRDGAATGNRPGRALRRAAV